MSRTDIENFIDGETSLIAFDVLIEPSMQKGPVDGMHTDSLYAHSGNVLS